MLERCGLDPDLRSLWPDRRGKRLTSGQTALALRVTGFVVDLGHAVGDQKLQTVFVPDLDLRIWYPVLDPDGFRCILKQQSHGLDAWSDARNKIASPLEKSRRQFVASGTVRFSGGRSGSHDQDLGSNTQTFA